MIRSISSGTSYRTSFRNDSCESVADVPLEKGGEGKGFGPHELLEAAFATCVVLTVRIYATRHQLSVNSAECEVRLDRSRPNEVTFNYELVVEGDLSDEERDRIHDAVSRCPVAKTLAGAVSFEPIRFGNSTMEERT